MLFIDHCNAVLGMLRETAITSLSTDVSTEQWRAQEAVKRAVNRVWNAKQWSFKIRESELTMVSGTTSYPLPGYVGDIFSILSDQPPYKIDILKESQFDELNPNPIETGTARAARLFDMSGAIAQPTASSTVSVQSSSANDSTQTVLVKGLDSSGFVDLEELALAGTSPVSSTKSFSSIIAITKSAATAGAITVSAGATTLAIMWPQETIHRRRFLRVYPEADSTATVLTLKHFGPAPLLTSAYEDTEIPTKWDYVVNQWGFIFALQPKGIEQLEEFRAQFDAGMKLLDTDMASEEVISSQDIIIPQRWGSQGEYDRWNLPPNGYNWVS